ncbi:alpha/beta hydrolase [Chitinibacter sp. FCG-7]|uniref:Alpha/beta hydrolase n=1 Tax=Chitinibacter mangrovi TaxID=3153927 RepID=A0AAU7FD80_9NEIS
MPISSRFAHCLIYSSLICALSACGGGAYRDPTIDCLKKNPKASLDELKKCTTDTKTTPKPSPAATATPAPSPTSTGAPNNIRLSPPKQGLLSIGNNINLEYLDFGGKGEPVILLAGGGNTAYIYTRFAPMLSDQYRVIALSRRGYGASSQPSTGYDTATLSNDLHAAINALGLNRVTLIGHSIAGDEMTRFAALHPERVSRLVYLDAAYDRTAMLPVLLEKMPAIAEPEPTATQVASISGLQNYRQQTRGVRWPEEEIRALVKTTPQGEITEQVTPEHIEVQLITGVIAPDYSKVKAPALAIYAQPQKPSDVFPWLKPTDSQWLIAQTAINQTLLPAYQQQRDLFARTMAKQQTLVLPGANHYVFISHQDEVLRAIRAFMQ